MRKNVNKRETQTRNKKRDTANPWTPPCEIDPTLLSTRDHVQALDDGSSKFERLVASHHSGFSVACECNEEEIGDDDDDEIT